MNDFETYVRSLGFDPATLSAEQTAGLEAQWRKLHAAPAPAPTPGAGAGAGDGGPGPNSGQVKTAAELEFEQAAARVEADRERKAGIVSLAQRFIAAAPDRVQEIKSVADLAIKGTTSVKDAELQFLRMSYHSGPLAYSPSAPTVNEKVVEVAIARAAGVSREVVERDYDDKTLSAADKQFRGGIGLKRLVVMCARANGFRDADEGGFTGINSTKQLLRAAFRTPADDPWASAPWNASASTGFGPSTYDLSGILSNVMNKSIRDYFMAVEQVWRQITATRPVNDFKEISGYALTGDLTYKPVAPGGEVKHGTLGEETYGNQAKLYALMLGIDYQHLRNDDLGAFQRINQRLGRGGALTLNKVFWTEFLAANFWTTGNGNYAADTGYAWGLDGLENASVAWDLRTDPDGNPMGDEARYLLVPSSLDLKARRAMRSTTIGEDSGEGATNTLAGKWEPIASRYLQDATITGNSNSNYFLLADPMNLPVIETVFLDGQEMPTIETAEPDLSRLGIMVRGMHAFGCRRQEKRGGYKFKQTAD